MRHRDRRTRAGDGGGAPRHSLWRKARLTQGADDILALRRVTSARSRSMGSGQLPIAPTRKRADHQGAVAMAGPVPVRHRSSMRRRTFLTTALGAAAGAGLSLPGGCTATRSHSSPSSTASPSTSVPTPPSPTAAPTDFGTEPLWPPPGVVEVEEDTPVWEDECRVMCARGHCLTGSINARYLPDRTDLRGMCPVIVDLSGPDVYAVLPDDSGTSYRTSVVTLIEPPEETATPSPGAVTVLTAGPSALDDDHAYVIVGRNEGARATDGPTDLNGSLTLLKIRLSDADVVSSAQLSTGFPIYSLTTRNGPSGGIAPTSDGSALMLTTGSDPYLALRLSIADLSVQFDAHSVLTGTCRGDLGDEAVCTDKDSNITSGTTIVTLTDGAPHEVPKGDTPRFVCERWLYSSRYEPGGLAMVMTDLGTGEEVVLTGYPGTYSSPGNTTADGGYIITCASDQIDVRPPGSTTATLTWTTAERTVPASGLVYGANLYTRSASGRISVTDLESGNNIKNLQLDKARAGGGINAVTPYGISNGYCFYPASEWAEDPAPSSTGAS